MPRLQTARRVSLVSLVLLAGCSGGLASDAPAVGEPGETARSAARLGWLGLDKAADRLDRPTAGGDTSSPCEEGYGTLFAGFGVRGLACLAAGAVAPAVWLEAAPVAPFRSGPHTATAGGLDLDLSDARDFGRYDPAFVRWAWAAAVPERATARALVAPACRRHAARLARIYWLALDDLTEAGYPASVPSGPLADYAAYLDGGPVPDGAQGYPGGVFVFAFTDRSDRLLPEIGLPTSNEWTARYEANTAYGFWLRRRVDGTHGEWRDGLRDGLSAVDADWLAARERR